MNKLWRPIIFTLMLTMLGACAAGFGAVKEGITTDAEFNEVVLADVQAAKVLAEQGDDKLGVMCWTYLEEFTMTSANALGAEGPAGEVVGVFSAYQKARNLRHNVVEVKISDEFRINCGPMLTESAGALGRIGIRIISPL